MKVAEGSEHAVYFGESGSEVWKVTLPGTYGDYYELAANRVVQFRATPGDYLSRMRGWKKLFTLAPTPLGITATGQIVTKQLYVSGNRPSQEQVDEYLMTNGFQPVRQSCFLWARGGKIGDREIWVGDARDENFVETTGGIVPIDIRLWQDKAAETAG